MDWKNTGYQYDIGVNVIHQTNVNDKLGSLSGVQINGMTITENYYSDSRIQAKVKTVVKEGEDDGYIENARLRVILSVPDRSFFEELITGYVSDVDETHDKGYVQRTYTVEGTLWGLLEHKMDYPVVIAVGASMLDVWENLMMFQTKMQYSTAGAQDHSFANTVLYEPGSNLSTILFELSSGYSRMNVNGHGVVTLTKYTAPSKMTPIRTIDYNDLRGLAMTPLTKNSSKYEAPGRAVVTATISKEENGQTKQEVIAGSYDAPSTHPTSISVRGYLRGRTDSYNGTIEKPSKQDLAAEARKNWEDAQDKGVEWTASTVFADYHAGEVCSLILPTGYANQRKTSMVKVLVSQVTTNLDTMVQELTLKEV